VLKWYEVQARYFNVPLFIFDTPFCHTEFSDEARKYVKAQVMEYIDFLEKACGKKMDHDRMREVGYLSLEGSRMWQAVLDTTVNRPAPMSCFDAFFHLALIVTLRGAQVVVDYYQELEAELKQRVADGISAIPNERHRLMWDNLPVWNRMKWLSQKFAAGDACLVADTYTSAWCGTFPLMDPDDFLNSMAEVYSRVYLNIGVDEMAKTVFGMIDKYQADGFVMHSNRSCKPYSLGQYDIMRMVQEEKGIPCLMIEADMVDGRGFSESQVATRIDAFLELLEQRKG
jgi:benzoyl-CoA reductase/2-hydroxyglutaryl-CoA dehydratase subunit BcrC/BadD/HgdB